MRYFIILSLLAVFVGCSKTEGEKSEATQFIEGITGQTAVTDGKKAEETLRRVYKQENDKLEAVLNAN